MKALDCKTVRDYYLEQFKKELLTFDFCPTLIIIQVGNNPASNKYVSNKIKRCEEVGIKCELVKLEETVTQEELEICVLEKQRICSAIIVQEPLPKHLSAEKVNKMITFMNDCDGLSDYNMQCLYQGHPKIIPATPQGILNLFDYYNIDLDGKNILMIGRSKLVGHPLSEALNLRNATVTLAHSHTKDLEAKVSSGDYDIIISAIGKAKFIKHAKADYLIDVGINFDEQNKMCGDFDMTTAQCEYYTSVPGGVGLLTQAAIVGNVIKCYKLIHGILK